MVAEICRAVVQICGLVALVFIIYIMFRAVTRSL